MKLKNKTRNIQLFSQNPDFFLVIFLFFPQNRTQINVLHVTLIFFRVIKSGNDLIHRKCEVLLVTTTVFVPCLLTLASHAKLMALFQPTAGHFVGLGVFYCVFDLFFLLLL